jgi:hypothetical protein
LRITCGELLDGKPFGDVCGMVLYYKKTATLLYSPGVEDWLLVKCSDIIATEENDNARQACPNRSLPAESRGPERCYEGDY